MLFVITISAVFFIKHQLPRFESIAGRTKTLISGPDLGRWEDPDLGLYQDKMGTSIWGDLGLYGGTIAGRVN
jgi:hypothetical protein